MLQSLIVRKVASKKRRFADGHRVELQKISNQVARRTRKPLSKTDIGTKKAGLILYRYKMGKHFSLQIQDGHFSYRRRQDTIDEREQRLDGIYLISTSEPADRISSEDEAGTYKSQSDVD